MLVHFHEDSVLPFYLETFLSPSGSPLRNPCLWRASSGFSQGAHWIVSAPARALPKTESPALLLPVGLFLFTEWTERSHEVAAESAFLPCSLHTQQAPCALQEHSRLQHSK